MTQDEMVGWHHRLDGHDFEQAPGDDDGQGSLACCSPRGCKKSDTTEQVNNSPIPNLMTEEIICLKYRAGNEIGSPDTLSFFCLFGSLGILPFVSINVTVLSYIHFYIM